MSRAARSTVRLLAAVVALSAAASANAAFTINLNYSASTTASQQAYFNAAKATWEGVISGYQAYAADLSGLSISADVTPIDGAGGVLGSAGPNTANIRSGKYFTASGSMQFDSADVSNMISNGTFGDVVLHEMGHVLGIGTLWTYNGLYTDGTGQYTGVNGLAAYKVEFNQPAATFVPVELGGGGGTANGHWNEGDGGTATGITSLYTGKDLRFELMTGWLNAPAFLSSLTRYSMVDLGYTVNAVPEPTTLAALGGVAVVALRRRRRGATVA